MQQLSCALLTLLVANAFCTAASGQFHAPPLHPWETPCVDGQCQPNSFNYGFYQTHWRRWPTSLPRVEPGPASRGGGLESLPRVETPDPRFEGEISPPIGADESSTPPDRPAATPQLPSPDLTPPELPSPGPPAPDVPSRGRSNPRRDSHDPPSSHGGATFDLPLPPTLAHSPRPVETMRTEHAPSVASAEPERLSTNPVTGSLPPRSRAASEAHLAAHEPTAVEMKIVPPTSLTTNPASPASTQQIELPEYVILDEVNPASAIPPRPVIHTPVIKEPVTPRRAAPAKNEPTPDLLFESLRVSSPPRDPLFEAIR
jgi:hypothetical protein